MGFRNAKVGGGLENQLKIADGQTVYVKIMEDVYETWDEVWPTFPSGDGTVRQRYVGDRAEKNSNLKPIIQYKKECGIPDGLSERDQGNWKISPRHATIVAIGTESTIKVTPAMAKKRPALKKLVGKTQRKIVYDRDNPKILIFGVDILRQLKGINDDPDNRDKMEEKGISLDEHLPTDVFGVKISKEKTKQRITYDVKVGKWVGLWDESENESFNKVKKELDGYLSPSDESDIDDFLAENGEGGSSGSEVESTVDDDEPDTSDDIDIDVDEEKPKNKKKNGKKSKKKEPKDEDLEPDEDSDDSDGSDEEVEPDEDSDSESSDDDDLPLDDIDDLLGD